MSANASSNTPIKGRKGLKYTNPAVPATNDTGKSYGNPNGDSDDDKQNQIVIPKLKPIPEQVPHLPTYVDTVAKARGVRQASGSSELPENSSWDGDYYGLKDYGIYALSLFSALSLLLSFSATGAPSGLWPIPAATYPPANLRCMADASTPGSNLSSGVPSMDGGRFDTRQQLILRRTFDGLRKVRHSADSAIWGSCGRYWRNSYGDSINGR
ncbi:hypothetical protein FPQ18DRAFT_394727 [Pyronema domesticum]|nr:hypothetical protein FPQ18DRAFT_394727 [Pyronema domesticum]